MKKTHAILTVITVAVFLNLSWNNDSTVKVKNDSDVLEWELDEAFKNFWPNITLSKADEFFKTNVSVDFYTINSDGIVQNKAQCIY